MITEAKTSKEQENDLATHVNPVLMLIWGVIREAKSTGTITPKKYIEEDYYYYSSEEYIEHCISVNVRA